MKIYRLNPSEFRSWRDIQTRKELQERLYKALGEAQIRAPSGRILGTVRSAERSVRVPAAKANVRGAHHALSPGECVCREWQKPAGREKEHHPICVNRSHWEAQQAHSPDLPRERAVLRSGAPKRPTKAEPAQPKKTLEPTGELVSTELVPSDETTGDHAPEPKTCECREWSGAENGKHHALCQHRARWELEHAVVPPKLIELETGAEAREATLEELEASQTKRAEDGVGAIQLSDGKLYYVRAAQ